MTQISMLSNSNALLTIGLILAASTIAAVLWSIIHPKTRIWPTRRYTASTPFLVWVPTFSLFGIIIWLGVIEWGQIAVSNSLRYGAALPLIVIANIAVWIEVGHFGVAQTGGASGTLRTDGLYRYSRNPQYVADITMITGWVLLCASPSAASLAIPSISILLLAPFAEEPWLTDRYGADYIAYRKRVRRFL
jgi:protein-S-isoprenylcysteine O-methyltransferase Ste14